MADPDRPDAPKAPDASTSPDAPASSEAPASSGAPASPAQTPPHDPSTIGPERPVAAPVVAERGAPPPPKGVLGFLVRHQAIVVPIVSVVLAFAIGAILIRAQGYNPTYAYRRLFEYAFLTEGGLLSTFQKTTPLILVGLAVAIPLKVGLFNIGGQGQLMAGGIGAAWVAYALRDLPAPLLVLAAVVVAVLFGAMWASIAALLKTTRGVHEVISTIMLNSIAVGIIDWLINGGPLADPAQPFPSSHAVPEGARLLPLGVIPWGLPVALVLAVLVAWMLRRTTLGFELQTVGRNKFAAGYAGISTTKATLLAMLMSGGLAGLAGAFELLQIAPYRYQGGIAGSLGFDGITIALLARGNPLGTIPAAVLVAAMRAGAPTLQFDLGIRPEIVDLLLAITLLMVSLPVIAKWIFRRHAVKQTQLAGSWGA
ncbi:nucleoside ABC transporter membrane protein [Knoellia remsis]|uniref:Nucleoside ABC transporter membrane protein n=1 Tax=Knoellia remsis TaxID=407159 RepID=A0A2T0TW67_9MICO|nr:ABC transporter permease [Knoellia remsis]PRY49952.1 nucleoside ABC transporter membrane protein [Knoellia remsis]